MVRLGVRVTTQRLGPKVPFTGALGDMRENPPRVLVALSTGAGRGSNNSRAPGLEQSNAKLREMSETQATPRLEATGMTRPHPMKSRMSLAYVRQHLSSCGSRFSMHFSLACVRRVM
ncbi:hypothetical protein FVEG_10259 [Fusarium verticillioides 7600]|uniref:Uncharacterized protein n=1 Tax=Gibberella moniliformis (strain M3125 / FGSC 7600) TaxID=334819 RepID=W7MHI1_GIBM7|nr:hypothetical protein FVEG_10259 [Fusarium verticillioides 7600]EWG51188.1 hypothetical protein FVEG_10259 [Fusarium verticillioides 7600]